MDFDFYSEKITPRSFPEAEEVKDEPKDNKAYIHTPKSLEDARRKYIQDNVDVLINELCSIMVTSTTQSAKLVVKVGLKGIYEQLMRDIIIERFSISGWAVDVILNYDDPGNCKVILEWRENDKSI